MNSLEQSATPNRRSPASGGYARTLDFQTAPYEALCGCVGVEIPSSYNWAYEDRGEPRGNPQVTAELIRNGKGRRIVCVNCSKCGGTGIAHNK